MTEYDNTQDAARTPGGGAILGVDMLDVLIRNLETAKASFAEAGTKLEEGKGLAAAEGPVFCSLLYAVPGQICPFFYFHTLTEETAPVK